MFQMKTSLTEARTLDPSHNMKASEYILLLHLQVHVVAAANNLLQFDVDMSIFQVAQSIVNTHRLLPCKEPEEHFIGWSDLIC